jgi:methionine biosynthesis protein MetW
VSSRYEADIDLGNTNISHTQLVELIGRDSSVLDVGCAGGDLARVLLERGCRVSGVDIDSEAAEAARPILDELVITDLDQARLSDHFKDGSFDVIVFGDVLEHLMDPASVLRDAARLLAAGGRIVVSVPNVAHASLRLALLQGRWSYTSTGLLDATHIRFFTRESICDLIEETGYVIEDLCSTVADPLATEVQVDGRRLPAAVIEWVRHQPDALNYQYVIGAHAAASDEVRGARPQLVPALPPSDVCLVDEHTERMRAEQAEAHRMLTIRDHIMGLEASTARANAGAKSAAARADRAIQRAKRLRKELDDVTQVLERGSQTRSVRALAARLRARRHPDASQPDD